MKISFQMVGKNNKIGVLLVKDQILQFSFSLMLARNQDSNKKL